MNKFDAFVKIVKTEIFDNPSIYYENYSDIYEDAEEYFNLLLKNNTTETREITDNGKVILKYMQDNNVQMAKSRDIAEGLGISSRVVSGVLRKLVADGFCDKMGREPVLYSLTEKGKNYEIN